MQRTSEAAKVTIRVSKIRDHDSVLRIGWQRICALTAAGRRLKSGVCSSVITLGADCYMHICLSADNAPSVLTHLLLLLVGQSELHTRGGFLQ